MDDACYRMDEMLASFLHQWRTAGYEVIVTADHGQDARGHHGGTGELQQEFAFYYFGDAEMPAADVVLDQLALAPSILSRMGVAVPDSMKAKPFMQG
jgi:predicted AlkP superfamily pyrophosphatase or phosphodiesterase